MALCAAALLCACAGGPQVKSDGANRSVTPDEAVSNAETLSGTRVLWGGVIVSSKNLANRTVVEVLAYPLDGDQRPETDAQPLGRFLAERNGYLETADYRAGRELTVVGPLQGVRSGNVGEATYQYPVVDAEELYLWPYNGTGTRGPFFHFGLGVVL